MTKKKFWGKTNRTLTQHYEYFDLTVKLARGRWETKDPTVFDTTHRLFDHLMEVLKPWTANNIAIVMRSKFEHTVNRVGTSKKAILRGWIRQIMGEEEYSSFLQKLTLRQLVTQLQKSYPKEH